MYKDWFAFILIRFVLFRFHIGIFVGLGMTNCNLKAIRLKLVPLFCIESVLDFTLICF